MSYLRKLSVAFGAGIANGTLFYIIGAVANTVVSSINPLACFLLGMGAAIAISLNEANKKQE